MPIYYLKSILKTRLFTPSVLEKMTGNILERYGNPNNFWFNGLLREREGQIQINILDITIYDHQQPKTVEYQFQNLTSNFRSDYEDKMNDQPEVTTDRCYTPNQQYFIPNDDSIQEAFKVLFVQIKHIPTVNISKTGRNFSYFYPFYRHMGIAAIDRLQSPETLKERFDYRMEKAKWKIKDWKFHEKVMKIGHDRAIGTFQVANEKYINDIKARLSGEKFTECNLFDLEKYFRREYNNIPFTYGAQKYKEIKSNLKYQQGIIEKALNYKYDGEEPMYEEEDYEMYLIKHHESMRLNICPNKSCQVPLILHARTDPELCVCWICCELNPNINDKSSHFIKFRGIKAGDEQEGIDFAKVLESLNLKFTDDLIFPEGVRFTGTVYNATYLTGKDVTVYDDLKKYTKMGIYPVLRIKDFGGQKKYGVVATRDFPVMMILRNMQER